MSKKFTSIELFGGCGGLALGMEKAGFDQKIVVEQNKRACETLRFNRPKWNVVEDDIKNVDFKPYEGVDFVSGGAPCQAFSYAGKRLGFEDTRGTVFHHYAILLQKLQ